MSESRNTKTVAVVVAVVVSAIALSGLAWRFRKQLISLVKLVRGIGK